MFLGIQKIGKSQHKFKAKVVFYKVVNEPTNKGNSFKVFIQRRSHHISAVSEPSENGIGLFAHQEYMIPMTLLCNEDSQQIKQRKYLQKQATIRIFECDQNGKEVKEVGKKVMDWSEYVKKGKIRKQIDLESNEKFDRPKLTIQFQLEAQDDEPKSMQTYSSDNDQKNDKENIVQNEEEDFKINIKNQETKMKEEKIGNGLSNENNLKKTAQTNSKHIKRKDSLRMNLTTLQVKKSEDQKRKFSEDIENGVNSPLNKTPFPRSLTISSKKSIQDQYQIPTTKCQIKDLLQGVREQEYNEGSKKEIKEQDEADQYIPNTKSLHASLTLTEADSTQLQAYLLKKTLKEKQSQILSLKKQNDALRRTVDRLVQEAASAKLTSNKSGSDRQSEQARKANVSRDISIDQLVTTNKILTARQQQYERTITRLRQQVIMGRQKIIDMKYRQAFLMQALFLSANMEALEEASRFLSV